MSTAAWVACGVAAAWGACARMDGAEALARISCGRLRPRAAGRHAEDAAEDDAAVPEPTMVLELMMVALRSGASIPRALQLVGKAVSGTCCRTLMGVSDSLLAGGEWAMSWHRALEGPDGATFAAVEEALEPAWRHGSSPLPRMEAAVDALARESRDRMESEAAKLQTSVLLPVGLCFLPAFIVIGVVPVVAGWAAGAW